MFCASGHNQAHYIQMVCDNLLLYGCYEDSYGRASLNLLFLSGFRWFHSFEFISVEWVMGLSAGDTGYLCSIGLLGC